MYLKLNKRKLSSSGLKEDEDYFAETLRDFGGKQWSKVNNVFDNTIAIRPKEHDYYYKTIYKKQKIVLHGTHGFLSNDIANLSKRRVSTSYLIGTTGIIYELFDPKYWSYHIGKTPKGAWWRNQAESRSTIAIELSNFGDLRPHRTKPDILIDAWGYPYCMKANKDLYIKCPKYRGYQYYATYADAQIKALDSLLLKLCRKFDIPHTFLSPNERMEYQITKPEAGILAHVNYRQDKKDISPALLWEKISGR